MQGGGTDEPRLSSGSNKFIWFQGKLVRKLTLRQFLTLSIRKVCKVIFSKSLNPSRVEQNYTIYIKMAKTIYWNKKCKFLTYHKVLKTRPWFKFRMFENEKPEIVLKTVKGFNMERTPFIILIVERSLKLGIVVLAILFIVFIINLCSRIWAEIIKIQSFNLCPFLTLSVRNGSSVSFGTNVPCNRPDIFCPFSVTNYYR